MLLKTISICNWQIIVPRPPAGFEKKVVYWNSWKRFDIHQTVVSSGGLSQLDSSSAIHESRFLQYITQCLKYSFTVLLYTVLLLKSCSSLLIVPWMFMFGGSNLTPVSLQARSTLWRNSWSSLSLVRALRYSCYTLIKISRILPVLANNKEITVTWFCIVHYLMLMGTFVSPKLLADGG